ncbi:MAG: hypothetical protein GPJ51_01380 [Candidatus Heimdallarchaeota archaeon]|nr:hypothetical protein [Candidatus Heimdallarchaeota archaeon]
MSKKKQIILSLIVILFFISFLSIEPTIIYANSSISQDVESRPSFPNSYETLTWSWGGSEVISSESAGISGNAALIVDTLGNVHVAWADSSNIFGSGTDYDICYKKWDVALKSWTLTEVVSTESTANSWYPDIAVDLFGNIHIAWQDITDYNGCGTDIDVFYKRFTNATDSWTNTEVVTTLSNDVFDKDFVTLDVDSSGNAHLAWRDASGYGASGQDYDINYQRWNATSDTWTITEVISTESFEAYSFSPSLAVDISGNIHIAWQDSYNYLGITGTDFDIFYKRWDIGLSSWTGVEVVSTESTVSSREPSLAVDTSGNVHISWNDATNYTNSGLDWDIFYKSWNSGLNSWTGVEVVSTESTGESYYSSLAIDYLNNVHIAWRSIEDYGESGLDRDIFYKKLDGTSLTWSLTEVVSTESTGDSYRPSLDVDSSGFVHIAWGDYTNILGCGADKDIFYKSFSLNDVISNLETPKLAYILPNPSETGIIFVDWNDLIDVTTYHIFRSSSYIWTTETLSAIASVSISNYTDTLTTNGFYHYVIVAEYSVGNSSHSNCEYVEVNLPGLATPDLAIITPNPTASDSIYLVWDDVEGATGYYIYRDTIYLWYVEYYGPVGYTSSSYYIDTLSTEGTYFYVIVATDGITNSTISNCEYVHYELPHLREFTITTSLLLVALVISFFVFRKRKK